MVGRHFDYESLVGPDGDDSVDGSEIAKQDVELEEAFVAYKGAATAIEVGYDDERHNSQILDDELVPTVPALPRSVVREIFSGIVVDDDKQS